MVTCSVLKRTYYFQVEIYGLQLPTAGTFLGLPAKLRRSLETEFCPHERLKDHENIFFSSSFLSRLSFLSALEIYQPTYQSDDSLLNLFQFFVNLLFKYKPQN